MFQELCLVFLVSSLVVATFKNDKEPGLHHHLLEVLQDHHEADDWDD